MASGLIQMMPKTMVYSLLRFVLYFDSLITLPIFPFVFPKVKDGSPASGILTVGTRILEVSMANAISLSPVLAMVAVFFSASFATCMYL
jgi:hypothetical protein